MPNFPLCETPDFLRIVQIFKIIVTVIKYAAPIALIIFMSLEISKAVISDEQGIKKMWTNNKNKIISVCMVFLVPTILEFVIGIVSENTDYSSCWLNATNEKIEQFQIIWDEEMKEVNQINSGSSTTTNNNPGYTSSNSHTSSITGIKYKLYNQTDSKWGNKQYSYPTGKTISDIGCMITSVAVISSSYDDSITPLTVFNRYSGSYPYDSIPKLTNNNMTCHMKYSVSNEEIIKSLKDGNAVIIQVKEQSNFTNSQHYIALIDIKSNGSQIFIGNSYGNGSGTYNRNGWFDKNVVLKDIHEIHICTPSSTLKDKFK